MYNFRDINDNTGSMQELSSVSLTLNGKVLENEISGFTVLTVEGRELMGKVISTSSIQNVDGLIVEDVKLPHRIIKVNYVLKANSNADYRDKFNRLNILLHGLDKKIKTFSFADEPLMTYEGYIESIDQPSCETNTAIASFTLICPKPFKYKAIETTTGTIPTGTSYKVEFIEISATVLTGNKIVVKNNNTGESMVLNGTYTSGQVLKITKDAITLNGSNIIKNLDFTVSIWKNFRLREGDTISITGGTGLSVKYRRCLL